MNVILLAGGFAKRMWPLTKNQPKHLLPVAGKPMLSYVLEKLEKSNVDTVYISTNAKFKSHFQNFLDRYRKNSKLKIELIIEDTLSEEEKLGSIGALGLIIESKALYDDLMIIGADNIFSFELSDFIDYFEEKNASVIAVYDVKNLEMAKKYGIVKVDENNKIIEFVEKPEKPSSTLAATACYILKRDDALSILQYLSEGKPADRMGDFISWLYKRSDIYAYKFSDYWFDIGSLEGLKMADEFLSKKG